MSFEYLDHKADLGIKVSAPTFTKLFEEAAQALFSVMYDPRHIASRCSVPFEIHAVDRETAVVEFLNEIISRIDRTELFFSCCNDLTISENETGVSVRGVLWGDKQGCTRHHLRREVKAATYSGLKLEKNNENYVFQCLLDI
jgi:SHS2 domain-containing protein